MASGRTRRRPSRASTRRTASDVVGIVPLSDAYDVNAAVAAAKAAYHTWRDLSWVKRAEIIDNFAQLLKRDIVELGVLCTRECGKAINEGRADAVEALHMAQYIAGLGRLPIGQVISSEIAEKDAFILRKPKGVVACITPWNFPVAIPLWVILPAVLAGNTVVFKPAEQTPICGHKLMELFEEAGFPKGVINLVQGMGEEVGDPLVRHKDVAAVLFTGSRAVGKHIQQVAAGDAYKFAATEMGGKNATIVLADADLDLAVNACVLGSLKTTGQRCVSTSRDASSTSRSSPSSPTCTWSARSASASATACWRRPSWVRSSRRAASRSGRTTTRRPRRKAGRSCSGASG